MRFVRSLFCLSFVAVYLVCAPVAHADSPPNGTPGEVVFGDFNGDRVKDEITPYYWSAGSHEAGAKFTCDYELKLGRRSGGFRPAVLRHLEFTMNNAGLAFGCPRVMNPVRLGSVEKTTADLNRNRRDEVFLFYHEFSSSWPIEFQGSNLASWEPGTGRFSPIKVPSAIGIEMDVAVGDINDDRRADLIVRRSAPGAQQVYVLLTDRRGTPVYETEICPEYRQVDLDHRRPRELVMHCQEIRNATTGEFRVYDFRRKQTSKVMQHPVELGVQYKAEAFDYNGDCALDLKIQPTGQVYVNDGGNRFRPAAGG